MSSSSGKYGESTSRHSSPRRIAVAVVCQRRLVTTTTFSWTATARRRSRDLQQLGRVAEGLDLLGRFLLPRLELLPAAVDPDHRHPLLEAGLHVGVVAARDVHPAGLAAHPPRALLEVRRVGLVAADLLRGHDEVEVHAEVAPGGPEQLVVDVREDPDLELLGEALELGVGLAI